MTDSQSLILELFDLYINMYISLGKPQFNIRLSSSYTLRKIILKLNSKICAKNTSNKNYISAREKMSRKISREKLSENYKERNRIVFANSRCVFTCGEYKSAVKFNKKRNKNKFECLKYLKSRSKNIIKKMNIFLAAIKKATIKDDRKYAQTNS